MELVWAVYDTNSPFVPHPYQRLVPNGGTDDRRDVFHVSFDPAEESVTEVVTDAVTVIHDTEPQALTPLARGLDVDALELLLAGPADRQPEYLEVQFEYEGLEITIASSGDLWLQRT